MEQGRGAGRGALNRGEIGMPDPLATNTLGGLFRANLRALRQRLLCALNRHDYVLLGLDYKDEIFRCRACGQRHVRHYTLRIDRMA